MADSSKGLWNRLREGARARGQGESDAPVDTGTAYSRDAGGGEPEAGETQDKNSSTGTTPSGGSVGRAAGDESGDVGESGGERGAGRDSGEDEHEGALRDD